MTQSALMPPDLGVTVGAWNALVRRARVGRERKAAAIVFSSYADSDGTDIHCGVARLAVDLEIGYSTARRYLAWLRDVGLIELVRHGNQRKGLSDEYRLILGPDLLERLDVPDPAEYDRLRNELRDANRAGSARRTQRVRQQPKPITPATVLRSPTESAEQADPARESALDIVSAEQADLRSPETPSALTQDEPPPSLYTSPEELTSPTSTGDLRTKAAGPCAREAPKDQISPNDEHRSEPSAPDSDTASPATALQALLNPPPAPARPACPTGLGFCVTCYATGATTLAADPVAGSYCAHHTQEQARV